MGLEATVGHYQQMMVLVRSAVQLLRMRTSAEEIRTVLVLPSTFCHSWVSKGVKFYADLATVSDVMR